jgi:hypothetical protein
MDANNPSDFRVHSAFRVHPFVLAASFVHPPLKVRIRVYSRSFAVNLCFPLVSIRGPFCGAIKSLPSLRRQQLLLGRLTLAISR